MPVGRCVIRTAESVVLTRLPARARLTGTRRYAGRSGRSSTSVSSTSGGDQHAGRRGVDAALGLGRRHPLDPVHAALPLEPRPHAVPALGYALGLDRDRDVLEPAEVGLLAVEHLGDPAVPFGVPQVHPQQVAGEQRRLLAALARLDLEDDVLAVVGVARREQLGELLLQRRDALLQRVGLDREAGVLGGQLAGRGQVGAGLVQLGGGLVDRGQLGEPPADPAGGDLVGVDRRVGQPPLQLGVLVEQRAQAVRAHRVGLPGRTARIRAHSNGARLPAGTGGGGRRRGRYLLLRLRPWRTSAGTSPPGRRCRARAACPCRTGGTRCTSRRGSARSWRCSGW